MENIKINDIDPSLPTFHFTEAEREEMKKRGLSEEDIDKKEVEARNRLAQNQLEKEFDQAA